MAFRLDEVLDDPGKMSAFMKGVKAGITASRTHDDNPKAVHGANRNPFNPVSSAQAQAEVQLLRGKLREAQSRCQATARLVAKQRQALAEQAAELQKTSSHHYAQAQKQAQLEAHVARLNSDVNYYKGLYAAAVDRLVEQQETNVEQVERLEEDAQNALAAHKAAEEHHAAELAELQAQLEAAHNAFIAKEDTVQGLEHTVGDLQGALDAATEQHSAEMAELRAELEAAHAAHAAKLAEVVQDHKRRIERMTEDSDEEAIVIRNLNKSLKASEQQRQELTKTLTAVTQERDGLACERTAVGHVFGEALEDCRQQSRRVDKAEAQVAALQEQLLALRAQLHAPIQQPQEAAQPVDSPECSGQARPDQPTHTPATQGQAFEEELSMAVQTLEALQGELQAAGCAGPQEVHAQQPGGIKWVSEGEVEIRDLLGAGGCGAVYAATCASIGDGTMPLAYKMSLDGQPLTKEAIMQAVLRHDHILPCSAIVIDDSGVVIGVLMPLMESTLDDLCRAAWARGQQLPAALRDAILCQVAEALAHVHERGLIHCDVKAANVLLGGGKTGRYAAHLADFGLAGWSADGAVHDPLGGTRGYWAPEVEFRGHDGVTAAADVFSFGRLMYWLVTGQDPYSVTLLPEEIDYQQYRLAEHSEVWLPLQGMADPSWSDLIRCCTRLDPAARPTACALADIFASR